MKAAVDFNSEVNDLNIVQIVWENLNLTQKWMFM